jgi:hypothetical protein
MEERLGHEFASVRVHDDSHAAASARAVDAHAYTVGEDIVFAAGRYDPKSAAGATLLAHELAHVVQQSSAAPAPLRVAGATVSDIALEREADAVAASAMHAYGRGAGIHAIQRQVAVAAPAPAERQRVLDLFTQRHYGVLERARRTPMAIQTGDQGADEVLWTLEAMFTRAERMRRFLKTHFGDDKDLRVTSVVKPGEHTAWRKMDVVPDGTTTWEELAAAAVDAGFWVHAEGVTLAGRSWPLSPLASGAHLDLYLINRVAGDFPLPEEGPGGTVPT